MDDEKAIRGSSARGKRWRRSIPLLVGLLLTARLATLGLAPLVDPSEGRYALISRDMAASGNYLTPMIWRAGKRVVFWGKPPLRFWTGALAFKIFGTNEFAARIPSFMSGIALLALLWWIVRRYRSEREARTATLFLAASGGFFFLSGVVLQEMTLTAFTSAATLLYYGFLQEPNEKTRWRLSVGVFVALGLGFMTKGPVALVVFGLPVFLWHSLNRRRSVLRKHAWGVGGALFLLTTLPWFWMEERATPGFLRYFFLNENFYRFFRSDYGDLYGTGHKFPFGTAFAFFLALSAPWCLVALSKCVDVIAKTAGGAKEKALGLWRAANDSAGDLNVEADLFLLGFAANVLFFCFARQLHLYYMITAIPPFCVWLASFTSETDWDERYFTKLSWLALSVYLAAAVVVPSIVAERGKSTKRIIAKAIEIRRNNGLDGKIVFVGKTPYSAYFYGNGLVDIHKDEAIEASFRRLPENSIHVVSRRHWRMEVQAETAKRCETLYSNAGWVILKCRPGSKRL